MMLQAVFFDMGGTIETFSHDSELCLEATPDLRQLLREGGIDLGLSPEDLYKVVTEGLHRYRSYCASSLVELPTARIWGQYILDRHQVDAQRLEAIAEDLTVFIETRYYHREMRPEMPQVLEAIQTMGLKMGVISNVMSRGQVPRNLELYGIKHYFDPIVMSSVYGRRKPGPGIFHHAARLVGVPATACAHVGDRIDRDILGAQRAGYRLAIQVRHGHDEGKIDGGPSPYAMLEDMRGLVELLQNELQRTPAGPTPAATSRDL